MSRIIEQQHIPYWEWEDWLNGMWRKLSKDCEGEYLKAAIKFTGNWVEYGEAMGEVIIAWPRTMLNSLTNKSINKRAFLGHCAAAYKINCPEYITRQAWHKLTDLQKYEADKVAQSHIDNWLYEKENKGLYKNVEGKVLHLWNTR